uniref:NADPH-dependent 7-cyano-7-deazaguanine reductase n=1 Tax=uncultured Bacteroidota bacterium TaxID=152509 RepID=H5SNT7_9BACT|nr:7-cyano-7-deazaguanine reductase [uncultured Bacteroidetes bacterium]
MYKPLGVSYLWAMPIRIADTRAEVRKPERRSILQTFPFQTEVPQVIHLHTEEFSAVCPGTGLPDIGTLDLWYIPKDRCIELKSLKLYLFSYRNEEIFQEPVADLIFEDLWAVLEPRYMRLSLRYNIRGGILTTVHLARGELVELPPEVRELLP